MAGVGGKGPKVTKDILVTAQFLTKTGLTSDFAVSCGVVPDGTFPGDLVLGKTIFHKWTIHCTPDETLRLFTFPHQPELIPCVDQPLAYSAEESAFPATSPLPKEPRWHPDTPVQDPYVQTCLHEYYDKFPGLFDPAQRRTDVLAKTQHRIDTGDNQPFRQPPRRFSPAQEQAIRDFVKAHDGTLIRKSKSPWASASHLVPKKPAPLSRDKPQPQQTIWRFCCDYRELNKRTKKHAHPMPNAMDQIQRAAGHRCYAFIDLKDGFWHLRIFHRDIEKTAFITPFGLYEWLVMPFGLCNAPATFQALIEEIFEDLRDFTCGLLDDIAVWADTKPQLHERLLVVFERLHRYGLVLNTLKTSLFVPRGTFLGFLVSEDGITADPAKIAAIRDRPLPATTTEVRGFVNAAGYLRNLIKGYSERTGALTDYTGGPKGQSVTLSDKARQQWQDIRDAITSLPVVRTFNWRLPSVIETDASQGFVGAALLQPHLHGTDSVLHPVSYFSKKLTDTQTRYSAQERELLGVLLALQYWSHWIQGTEITVLTDHESLKTLNTKADQPPRIVRFLDAIEHYGIRILYRPGKTNVLADYLSRPPTDTVFESSLPAVEREEGRDLPEQIRYPHELNRVDLQAVFEHLQAGADLPPAIAPEWVRKHFTIVNDQLSKIQVYRRQPGDPPHEAGTALRATLLLPVPEYDDLLVAVRKLHMTHGHATVGSTLREALKEYWHPEITLAVQQVVAECKECQLMKTPNPALPDLNPIAPPAPLTRWAIDFTSVDGVPILVAIEYVTGWVETEVTPDQRFESTLPLLERIVDTFGTPNEWISDNAGCFAGEAALAWHHQHGSKLRPVTPVRPRGNGKVEKANGDLKRVILREWLANPNRDIKASVRRATMLYNRIPKSSGYSPYFLLFGTLPPPKREPYVAYTREPTEQEEDDFARQLVKEHEAPLARNHATGLKASRDQIRAFLQEGKALLRVFAPGDWVLRVRQRAHKHEPYYDGPWAIVECCVGNTYTLRSPGGITLKNTYNGTNLFPAYVADGHPVRSLWYASKTMLERDRARVAQSVRLDPQQPTV